MLHGDQRSNRATSIANMSNQPNDAEVLMSGGDDTLERGIVIGIQPQKSPAGYALGSAFETIQVNAAPAAVKSSDVRSLRQRTSRGHVIQRNSVAFSSKVGLDNQKGAGMTIRLKEYELG